MVHIEKFEKEIKSKDQIINHILIPLENVTSYPRRNTVINNTVASPSLEIVPQIDQTACSLKQVIL